MTVGLFIGLLICYAPIGFVIWVVVSDLVEVHLDRDRLLAENARLKTDLAAQKSSNADLQARHDAVVDKSLQNFVLREVMLKAAADLTAAAQSPCPTED